MAVRAAMRRSSALSSLVETTTHIEARRDSGTSSMNSRTSRPRSPTSPTIVASKAPDVANMPRRVDFPTPDPAKMPSLCPSHIGVKRSIALTPVNTGFETIRRASAGGGAEFTSFDRMPRGSAGRLSMGAPKALTTRPSHPLVGKTASGPRRNRRLPGLSEGGVW